MNFLFIDANVLLKFYAGKKMFKVLQTLVDNRINVLITKQIADEVLRNSLTVNANNLVSTTDNLKWSKPPIPIKNISAATTASIDTVYNSYKELKTRIEEEIENYLSLVSRQEDEVTLKLKELFEGALEPSDEEISNAERLKLLGNPPGKKDDPIGDELSWIQALNRVNDGDRLIIVTNDQDYFTIYNKKSFLNSVLHDNLHKRGVVYFLYSEIGDGVKKLKELQEQSQAAFDQSDFPTTQEQDVIKVEEQSIVINTQHEVCNHRHVEIRQNGIFDDYFCADCNRVLYRQHGEFD